MMLLPILNTPLWFTITQINSESYPRVERIVIDCRFVMLLKEEGFVSNEIGCELMLDMVNGATKNPFVSQHRIEFFPKRTVISKSSCSDAGGM